MVGSSTEAEEDHEKAPAKEVQVEPEKACIFVSKTEEVVVADKVYFTHETVTND